MLKLRLDTNFCCKKNVCVCGKRDYVVGSKRKEPRKVIYIGKYFEKMSKLIENEFLMEIYRGIYR